MRLIDADAFKEQLESAYEYTELGEVIEMLDNAPTVDVEPFALVSFSKEELNRIVEERVIEPIKNGELVIKKDSPHGEWINEHCVDIGYKTAECSCCGERSRLISHDTGFGYEYEYYPFCHWCGADMRGGRE